MKRLPYTLALLALASAASGCVLYDDDDDDGDDDVCAYAGDSIGWAVRNPQTGTCEDFGGGGCYGAPEPVPDWASCWGECEGLDAQTCLGTSGCRAAYEFGECPPGGDCSTVGPFLGCWGTAPSGPVQGACDGLDAYECSRHDDCIAVYDTTSGESRFSYCAAEPGGPSGCEAVDCGPGSHCELQCYPCDPVDPNDTGCDSPCVATCVPDAPDCGDAALCPTGTHCEQVCSGNAGGCTIEECYPDSCWSECVPDDSADPGSCDGEVSCDALPPSCPDGTVPGIVNGCWSGFCIPLADCGPNDPGDCYAPVACDMAPPACPEGTTPGVANACYTGYCIPVWACDPTTTTCESLTTEADCAARSDCVPVYAGAGCTCYPNGTCTCEDWQFARCETAVYPQPL